jgi:predicted TIM-barrel fold metal-dependent hydrolase
MADVIDGYCTLGTERETRQSSEELLRRMDRAGVHRAVIAPEDREIAVDNVRGNDRILELSRRSGGRFIPACTVNPWFGRSGCDELRRAVAAGARMLVLAPALQGFHAGDDLADELLRTAGQLDVPVYVHTGPHSSSAPAQLVLLAARHAGVSFILGHCGSTDYAGDMSAVVEAATRNVWFETSLARPWAVEQIVAQASRLASAVETAAPQERRAVIFGSSAPRNDPAYELAQLARYLPRAECPDVYGGTLAALLKEPT